MYSAGSVNMCNVRVTQRSLRRFESHVGKLMIFARNQQKSKDCNLVPWRAEMGALAKT